MTEEDLKGRVDFILMELRNKAPGYEDANTMAGRTYRYLSEYIGSLESDAMKWRKYQAELASLREG